MSIPLSFPKHLAASLSRFGQVHREQVIIFLRHLRNFGRIPMLRSYACDTERLMKTHSFSSIVVLAAASALMLSTAAYARDNGGRGGDRGDRGHNRDSDFIWKDHENGCAVGNTPPPGANCTNRDDQRRR
jgi:hypothetical protein